MIQFDRKRLTWLVAGILAIVLMWSRLDGLDLSFWNDEVYTVVHYASRGPHAIFFSPYIPNNHVLFELLAWGTTAVVGTSETAYRLWGVVPAIGAAAWIVWWASRRLGRTVAIGMLFLLLVSPLLLEVSREARGYGLAMLSMAGLIVQGDSLSKNPSWRRCWQYAAFGLLGMLTLPVFVVPFALSAAPLLLVSSQRRRLVFAAGVAGLVALWWYRPMVGDIIAHSSQQFGEPTYWHSVVTLSVRQLLFPSYNLVLPGMGDVAVGPVEVAADLAPLWHALTWSLVIWGGAWLWRKGHTILLGCLCLPLFGTYLVASAFRFWVADRFVSYLCLPLFLLIAAGVKGMLDSVAGGRKAVLAFVVGIAAGWVLTSFLFLMVYVTNTPHEAFKEVAALANASEASTVLTNSVRPVGLDYYLDPPLERWQAKDLERLFCSDADQPYIFIDHRFLSGERLDTSCLANKGAERRSFRQRGRGSYIDIWFVGVSMPANASHKVTPTM